MRLKPVPRRPRLRHTEIDLRLARMPLEPDTRPTGGDAPPPALHTVAAGEYTSPRSPLDTVCAGAWRCVPLLAGHGRLQPPVDRRLGLGASFDNLVQGAPARRAIITPGVFRDAGATPPLSRCFSMTTPACASKHPDTLLHGHRYRHSFLSRETEWFASRLRKLVPQDRPVFISRTRWKWTKTCRSFGDFPHAHTARTFY